MYLHLFCSVGAKHCLCRRYARTERMNQGSGSKINKSVRTLRCKLPKKKYEIETTWKRKVVLHTYAYVYIYMHFYIYIYLYLSIYIYLFIFIYLSIDLSIDLSIYLSIFLCVCIYVCLWVFTDGFIDICLMDLDGFG